jgi:hypothetical protein
MMPKKPLTGEQSRDLFDLQDYWDAFCKHEPVPIENFISRMEAARFVRMYRIARADLESQFVDEQVLMKGGTIWRLTAKGRDALLQSKARKKCIHPA